MKHFSLFLLWLPVFILVSFLFSENRGPQKTEYFFSIISGKLSSFLLIHVLICLILLYKVSYFTNKLGEDSSNNIMFKYVLLVFLVTPCHQNGTGTVVRNFTFFMSHFSHRPPCRFDWCNWFYSSVLGVQDFTSIAYHSYLIVCIFVDQTQRRWFLYQREILLLHSRPNVCFMFRSKNGFLDNFHVSYRVVRVQ